MKSLKHLMFIILLATFTACNNNDGDSVEYAEVDFRVGMADKTFVRGVGEGSIINTLYVEAISSTGEKVRGEFPMSVENGGNARLSLAKGQLYNIIFWAQWKESVAYNITDLSNIEMIYPTNETQVVAMEKYDAYYAVMKNVEVTGSKSFDVEMSRPLTQVNILNLNDVDKTQVKFANIPTTFKPLEGTFGNNVDVTVNFEKNTQELTIDNVTYKHLAMMYIFTSPTGYKADCELTLTNGSNSSTISIPQLSLEANFKTNIIGSSSN